MIFASFLNFINLWADTCFLSTLQTRTLMLSEVAIYPSSGKDGGSLQMQVCVTQISAMSRVQPLWTNRTYRMAIDSFSCVSFSVNHLDFFFPLEIVSPLLCVQIIQVRLTLIPKVQEWVHDQGRANWSILTLGQSPWLVDGCVTDLDQEGQWDAFLGLLMRIGKKTGASSWLGLLF